MDSLSIHAETGSEAYLKLLKMLLDHGTEVSPRGFATKEILNTCVIVGDAHQAHVRGTSRKPNLKITATEVTHLLAGISSLAQLDLASGGRFSQFADDGRLRGAYGPRSWQQLSRVERLLLRDPSTRQAVSTVWNGGELSRPYRDVPCTTTQQFFLRDGRLILRVTMRSNDAWLGVPYDIEMYSFIQREMAASLGVETGYYVHVAGSSHFYTRDEDKIRRVVEDGIITQNLKGLPSTMPPGSTSGWIVRSHQAQSLALRKADGYHGEWWESHVPLLPQPWKLCKRCRYVLPGECRECVANLGEAA